MSAATWIVAILGSVAVVGIVLTIFFCTRTTLRLRRAATIDAEDAGDVEAKEDRDSVEELSDDGTESGSEDLEDDASETSPPTGSPTQSNEVRTNSDPQTALNGGSTVPGNDPQLPTLQPTETDILELYVAPQPATRPRGRRKVKKRRVSEPLILPVVGFPDAGTRAGGEGFAEPLRPPDGR
jgi:hypothetical protein